MDFRTLPNEVIKKYDTLVAKPSLGRLKDDWELLVTSVADGRVRTAEDWLRGIVFDLQTMRLSLLLAAECYPYASEPPLEGDDLTKDESQEQWLATWEFKYHMDSLAFRLYAAHERIVKMLVFALYDQVQAEDKKPFVKVRQGKRDIQWRQVTWRVVEAWADKYKGKVLFHDLLGPWSACRAQGSHCHQLLEYRHQETHSRGSVDGLYHEQELEPEPATAIFGDIPIGGLFHFSVKGGDPINKHSLWEEGCGAYLDLCRLVEYYIDNVPAILHGKAAAEHPVFPCKAPLPPGASDGSLARDGMQR